MFYLILSEFYTVTFMFLIRSFWDSPISLNGTFTGVWAGIGEGFFMLVYGMVGGRGGGGGRFGCFEWSDFEGRRFYSCRIGSVW